MPFLEAQGYEVHALDLRGHGKSEAKSAMRWNRISGYCDDVEEVVRQMDRPPVVVGHSMGGLVVQHLLQRDVTVSGAVLLGTVPSYGVWKVTLKTATSRPLAFAKTNLTMSLWPLVAKEAEARDMFLDLDVDPKTSIVFWKQLSDESYLGFLDMLLFALPKAKAVDVPMLVIGGEKDQLFSPASQQWTASRYACECAIIDDTPHDIMLGRNWQASAEKLVSWINSNVTK